MDKRLLTVHSVFVFKDRIFQEAMSLAFEIIDRPANNNKENCIKWAINCHDTAQKINDSFIDHCNSFNIKIL